ncbi:hypothetical protein CMEL01_04324, partial [Colletotrichum melonis]
LRVQKSTLLNTHPSPLDLDLDPFHFPRLSLTPHSSLPPYALRRRSTRNATQRNFSPTSTYLRTLARYLTDTAGARNLANQQILSRSGHDRFAGTRIHPHDRRLKYSRPTRKSKLETLGSGTLDSAEPRLFQLADEKQPGFGNNTIGSSKPDWKTQQLRSLRRLTISTTTTSTL